MPSEPNIYTVSQINALVKSALDQTLPPRLIVRGEIRDWKHHHSGHCYFLLKDQDGVLPAVMWASHFRTVRFRPEDGMAVLATGFIDVYLAGGKYQFYVDKLDPEGKGALQLAFEQMVAKLRSRRPVRRPPQEAHPGLCPADRHPDQPVRSGPARHP